MNIRIEELVADRAGFDSAVYTKLADAMKIIGGRQGDERLQQEIRKYLDDDIPEQVVSDTRFVTFRHICTPNFETNRFMNAVDAYQVKPLFWEYHRDKFTSNNMNKYHLGKMSFHLGYGRDGRHRVERKTIIDFNQANGKPIASAQTLWGDSLIDFHQDLMTARFPQFADSDNFFESSSWFAHNGGKAKEYYKKFLALFISHGILFENFMLSIEELEFTRDYFLPAFIEVSERFGCRPLIVALEPTEIENKEFWMCYPKSMLSSVEKKIDSV